jgi:hypothetical protein
MQSKESYADNVMQIDVKEKISILKTKVTVLAKSL